MFSEKSEIAIIGAGKIAYSLTSALTNAGYKIACIISRNKKSAKSLADKFNIPGYSANLNSISKKIKIFFLTVPDREIKNTADILSRLEINFKNSLFIHVSGALDINELSSLKKKKANVGSFHIMQTFPSKKIVEITGSSAAIETNNKIAEEYLLNLAENLKLNPFKLNSDKKIFYHLAGVYASNFLVGNSFIAEELFSLTKPGKDFYSVYSNTIKSTLENIRNSGSLNALSGPVERGDYETINKHIGALRKNRKLLLNYIVQSLNLIKVIKRRKHLNSGQKKINKLLKDELKKTLNVG